MSTENGLVTVDVMSNLNKYKKQVELLRELPNDAAYTKLADSLKTVAVYNTAGNASKTLVCKALATAFADESWKKLKDAEQKEYKSFPRFAFDYIPGLSRSADGKAIKDGTVTAWAAAGRVMNKYPTLDAMGLSIDNLHTIASLSDEAINAAIREDLFNADMTQKDIRETCAALAERFPKDGKAPKVRQNERLYSVPKYSRFLLASIGTGDNLPVMDWQPATPVKDAETMVNAEMMKERWKDFQKTIGVREAGVCVADPSTGDIYHFRIWFPSLRVAYTPYFKETQADADKRVAKTAMTPEQMAAQNQFFASMLAELDKESRELQEYGVPHNAALEKAHKIILGRYPDHYDDFVAWYNTATPVD